jgi:hypothetical protein
LIKIIIIVYKITKSNQKLLNNFQPNKENLKFKKISFGHRSPQGLFFDPNTSLLWETENGPRGGDELNLIKIGKHYGWPYVTFGLPYDNAGNLGTIFNDHDNFEKPVFTWMPSVAPSQLAKVFLNDDFGLQWKNSFIIGTLKDKSIHILRLDAKSEKILHSERIPIKERVRSLTIRPNIILLGTDSGSIITLTVEKSRKIYGTFPLHDYISSICAFDKGDEGCKEELSKYLSGQDKPMKKIRAFYNSLKMNLKCFLISDDC